MRRAAKVDDNHADIVQTFRGLGASVLDLSQMGGGCPDLLVAFQAPPRHEWRNVLVEIKDGEKQPSKQKLTPDQQVFFDYWKGPRFIVATVQDALDLVRYGRI